ncbi:MAG: hypothetical protein J5525_04940 [Lachnospiraceae bacterium]|nr:hypothetical protein [Lachnospiraceae bacterium]
MRKKRLQARIKRRIKDNKGIALVTVIIAIGFVAALVSILLMTTLVNFKMKVVNEEGTDTFYSAEQVLDEITVGLQRVVSNALSTSYTEILENYGDNTLDNTTKKQMIQTRYYEKVWEELQYSTSDHSKYKIEKLESFLKDSTKYHGYDLNGDGTEDTDEGFGAILVAVTNDATGAEIESADYGDMLTFSGTGIVLKNIKVYYRDVNGFVSVIQSDIRLNYPEFDFAKNSSMADIADYCFIADGGFERTHNGDLDISGNIYANNFATKGVNVKFSDNNLILVKHDIFIDGQSFRTGTGCNIWADNLKARSCTMNIDGSVNLSNDLNLLGDHPSVKLKGEFNGYGCSIDDADESSAILINGKKAKLDFDDVTKLKISGHAFLGLSSAGSSSSTHDYTSVDASTQYKDIYTGESVAAKSDQLMYLVPAEAIGVDEKTGRSKYNANPLTKAQYEDIVAQATYDDTHADSATSFVKVSDSTPISVLSGGTIAPYLKYDASSKPAVYEHKIRVNDASTGYLVFFYMQFADEVKANEYFAMYYSNNEKALAKYTNTYIEEIKFKHLVDSITAGSTYVTDATDAENDGLSIWPQSQLSASLVMNQDSSENLQKFKAYTTKLIPNFSELTGCASNDMNDIDSQVIFENVATDETHILEYIDRANDAGLSGSTFGTVTVNISGFGSNKTMTFTDSSDGSIAIVSTADVTVNDSNINLVVTTGEVTVTTTSFNGVILCNGKLKMSGTSAQTMTKSPELVRKCLGYGYEDAGLTYAIASCLANGDDYIYASYGSGGSSDTSLTGLVTYENWKKE